eukprot:IDg11537t1
MHATGRDSITRKSHQEAKSGESVADAYTSTGDELLSSTGSSSVQDCPVKSEPLLLDNPVHRMDATDPPSSRRPSHKAKKRAPAVGDSHLTKSQHHEELEMVHKHARRLPPKKDRKCEVDAREVLNELLLGVVCEVRQTRTFEALRVPLLVNRFRSGDSAHKRRRVTLLARAPALNVDLDTDFDDRISPCTTPPRTVQLARLVLEVVKENIACMFEELNAAEMVLSHVVQTPLSIARVAVSTTIEIFWLLDARWHLYRVEELCKNTHARVLHENLETEWIDLRDHRCWRLAVGVFCIP